MFLDAIMGNCLIDYISHSILHAVVIIMMNPRVAYHFSPVLPAELWPPTASIPPSTPADTNPPARYFALLQPSTLNDDCGWHRNSPSNNALLNFWILLKLSLCLLCCWTNMLGMFCIRALSSLTRLWTATHIKLLHSLPGITVAQVCCCMFVCVCVC